jgi:hypothetical protein
LRAGDAITLAVEPFEKTAARFSAGKATITEPHESLRDRVRRIGDVDLDTKDHDTPEKRPHRRTLLFQTVGILAGILLVAVLAAPNLWTSWLLLIAAGLLLAGVAFRAKLRGHRSVRFSVAPGGSLAEMTIYFDGKDGIYTCAARVEGKTTEGDRFTRDRRLNIFVAP